MDKATRPSGSQTFFDQTGSSDKTLTLYDGHVHDLLADLGKRLREDCCAPSSTDSGR